MNYWDKRILKLDEKSFRDADAYVKELRAYYDRERDKIQEKIYQRLARVQDEAGGLSLQEAKKLLNDNELVIFKRDLEDFRRMAQGPITPELDRELKLMSNRVRIARLQDMELELKKTVANLMTTEEKRLFAHLGKTYETRYYHELYELQRMTGYQPFQTVDKDQLEMILSSPWTADGIEFSSRIWDRRDKLVASLRQNLLQDLASGASPEETARTIARQFDASKANAARLVYTETAAISSKARQDTYKAIGMEHYQIVATLDLRTSELCRELDGRVFQMQDYQIGVTAPPFHPNCRSTTVPYFGDDIEKNLDAATQRMARNVHTGKSELIKPMSYQQWYEKYVDNRTNSGYNKKTGAIYGALNNKNDPDGKKREKHAKIFYESVRKRNRTNEIRRVSHHSGFSEEEIEKVYHHIFIEKHELGGVYRRFDENYDMAESWKRLFEGKDIQGHDIVLINHELYELELMQKYGMLYEEAHDIAENEYNYVKALVAWKLARGDL